MSPVPLASLSSDAHCVIVGDVRSLPVLSPQKSIMPRASVLESRTGLSVHPVDGWREAVFFFFFFFSFFFLVFLFSSIVR